MIREMAPGDAEAVARICERSLGHRADADRLRGRIPELAPDAHYLLLVCEWEDGVKGFLQAERYDLVYGGSGWNIIALAVAPEAQGQGIGRALLEAVEARAAEQKGGFVRLNSRVEREDAHAFYLHMGYRCDKLQKRFIKDMG